MRAWLRQRWLEIVAVLTPAHDLLTYEPSATRLRTDEACAADAERAQEATLTPDVKDATERVARAARELEAALNAYPSEIDARIERFRLDWEKSPSLHVFEVQVDIKQRVYPDKGRSA